MFSRIWTTKSTETYSSQLKQLKESLDQADAVLIGAGAGLSAAAGFTYTGERFTGNFADFIAAYHYSDMYTAGFYPYKTLEEYWAYWIRHIWLNRYVDAPKPLYGSLLKLVEDKDYFVLTTNVDHQFQKAGFDKTRLFYTQGDYGLWQCSGPCRRETYDNAEGVQRMMLEQKDMRVPTELVPHCPVCGRPMTMNLRCGNTFVEDKGWHRASARYADFLQRHKELRILYFELGVGMNTPAIIKYPFWRLTAQNPKAAYACINLGEAVRPKEITKQSICINADIGDVLEQLEI